MLVVKSRTGRVNHIATAQFIGTDLYTLCGYHVNRNAWTERNADRLCKICRQQMETLNWSGIERFGFKVVEIEAANA